MKETMQDEWKNLEWSGGMTEGKEADQCKEKDRRKIVESYGEGGTCIKDKDAIRDHR